MAVASDRRRAPPGGDGQPRRGDGPVMGRLERAGVARCAPSSTEGGPRSGCPTGARRGRSWPTKPKGETVLPRCSTPGRTAKGAALTPAEPDPGNPPRSGRSHSAASRAASRPSSSPAPINTTRWMPRRRSGARLHRLDLGGVRAASRPAGATGRSRSSRRAAARDRGSRAPAPRMQPKRSPTPSSATLSSAACNDLAERRTARADVGRLHPARGAQSPQRLA